MMDVTVVLTWPTHMDYPLWRAMFEPLRNQFKFVIAFSKHQEHLILTRQIQEVFPYAIFVGPIEATAIHDWRSVAVNGALERVTSQWVWFTEQDFFFKGDYLQEAQESMEKDLNCFATRTADETRIHPCSLFVRTEALEQTSKNFSAKPPVYDHFGKLTAELSNLGPIGAIGNPQNSMHMNGLTNNYDRFADRLDLYKKNDFLTYNYCALQVDKQIDAFKKIEEEISVYYPESKAVSATNPLYEDFFKEYGIHVY